METLIAAIILLELSLWRLMFRTGQSDPYLQEHRQWGSGVRANKLAPDYRRSWSNLVNGPLSGHSTLPSVLLADDNEK